jgi:formylmethanofuran dehydrogenase subunit C
MRGGKIVVRGNAGHLVGSAYRGSARGMAGGTLLVHGNVGNEIGCRMRRGLLAVAGQAGDMIGFNMGAGSIFVYGECGARHGAGMRRGTIGLFGNHPAPLLPTFRRACQGRFEFLALLDRGLRRHEFPAPREVGHMKATLFSGDLLEGGRGEILLPADVT